MKVILVIEDNSDILENVCEMLELRGYHLIPAINGKVGINLARQFKPDLILCDIMMPEANGYEVFNILKQDPDTASIPLIFISASVGNMEIEVCLEMGARDFIRKPFNANVLFEAIEKILGKQNDAEW
jgi:CheY-like chemotaxis protein